MPFQIVNLADNINAGIDKINENFELASWVVDSDAIRNVVNTYINSDTINNYIDQSTFINIIDSDYIQSIIFNTEINGQIDSGQFYEILAETGIVSRIDSVDGGFILLAQQFTNLSTSYDDLNDGISALSTANSSLTSQISVLESGIEVLSQDLVDLGAQFTGSIDIDSATIVEAIGGSLNILETRINANSDEINVVSQSILDLDAELKLLDSNLQTQITLSAAADQQILAQVTANDSSLSALSGQFSTFETRLDSAISEGLTITPEEVSNAVGGITDDLYALINANSDSISVITGDITNLESRLTLVDGPSGTIQANADATSALKTRVDLDSDKLVSLSSDVTNLRSDLDGSPWNPAITSAVSTAKSELNSRIDADSDRLTATSNFAINLESRIDSSDSFFATATSNLQTQVDDLGNASAVYTLNLNANGHVAGIEFNNDGATADMVITADKFGIVNASNNAVKPFTINGDNVELSNATVTGSLNISSTGNNGSMTMTNDVMKIFDGSNNLRVKFGRLE
jgi:hypothetical protein